VFEIRPVIFAPGDSLAYAEDDWRDALVLVARGEIMLETLSGGSWCFGQGDVLWLQDLPLAALHNQGDGQALLLAASRRVG
jgi:hypothetical protein